ncbi:AmmeMemoRadiSam system radical SAM enzyme [bacterium]|nr:AmmeMemoRadiSam system radical SAM enzyme [bacterium]
MVYGIPCVLALDPVEKCPLFHFKVNGGALSIATAGCNLSCDYCQNWQFSQKSPEETRNFSLPPAQVVSKALEYKASAIAFFYTEPTIYYEYVKDIAAEAKRLKLSTVMVSGGYINELPLKGLLDCIDAFVIGLKGFTEEFYQKVIHGTLSPVQNTLLTIKESSKHLEVVTLIVPTLNDQEENFRSESRWFLKNLGPDVPLHFTRFNPQFRLKGLPPTPVSALEKARKIAKDLGIHYVYTGNVPAHEGNHTYCSKCGKIVIERLGFQVLHNNLKNNACPWCETRVPGHWN